MHRLHLAHMGKGIDMNNPLYTIRVMVRTTTGWGSEYGEYGLPMVNKEAAIGLAASLRTEGKYAIVAVYECKIIDE